MRKGNRKGLEAVECTESQKKGKGMLWSEEGPGLGELRGRHRAGPLSVGTPSEQ